MNILKIRICIRKCLKKINKTIPVMGLSMLVVIVFLGFFALYMHNRQDAQQFAAQIESLPELVSMIEACKNDPTHELTLHAQCVKARYMMKKIVRV